MKTATLEKTESKELVIDLGLNDKAIDEMERMYLPLKLSGVDDKAGYEKIVEYRKIVKDHRIAVEKAHKEKKAYYLEGGRKVDSEKNRLLARILPIETHLKSQEDIVKLEKERIEADKQRRIEEEHILRLKSLIDAGAVFNGIAYVYGDSSIDERELRSLDHEEFEMLLDRITIWKMKEDQRKAEAEKVRKEEEARQAKIAEENRKRQEELDRKEREQAEREAKLKAEQDKIERERMERENQKRIEEAEKKAREDAEKKAAEDKIRHEQELAAAKLKAEEDEKRHKEELKQAKIKAEADAKARAEEEEKARIEAENKAKAKAEREEALKPDKDKLIAFAKLLQSVSLPNVKSPEVQRVLDQAVEKVDDIAAQILQSAKEL